MFSRPEHWTDEEKRKQKTSLTLSELLGLEDFISLDVWRASVGEVIGTAVLVFMLDTIVISTIETDIKMPNLVLSILAAIIIAILLLAVHPVSWRPHQPGYLLLRRPGWVDLHVKSHSALALKAVVSSTIEQTFSLGGCTLTVMAPGPNWTRYDRPRDWPKPFGLKYFAPLYSFLLQFGWHMIIAKQRN
ncbi:putative aquaporin TIP4-3 [Forsythia ovata]|uniref:Aquaporin TIP4-3 n=1 Tax=Forsythia ovata TaxID=205694 RepID=A0ABD1VK53_9LAMI